MAQSESRDPQTFEDFRRKMAEKGHWKEKIISKESLLRESFNFYIQRVQDYSINCLFIELLGLQIHLSERHEDFTFIYPIQEENNIFIYRSPEEVKNTIINKTNFLDCIDSLVDNDSTKDNLFNFLKENPGFDYYFWNVAFPNFFLGFISEEYCTRAAKILNYFQNDEAIFSKGVLSFVAHNYYFQDSFMKSYFINSQNLNFEESIQYSLKKAVQQLTIQQLESLEILIDKYPKKAMEMFLDKIIISSIKLWKYSPLFSPSQINGDGEKKLLDYIDTRFKNDADHEENLKNLLQPVFEAVKSKTTINEIKMCRIIFNVKHKFALTFLDILILQKIANLKLYSAQMGKLLDKFDERYLFKKAFYYIMFEKKEDEPDDIHDELKIKNKIELDKNYINQWKRFKEDKEKHNKNPLEVFFKEEELERLMNEDPKLALTGIALSYYDWLSYDKTKAMLKKESRVLILLKAILESQKSYMEIISRCYSFTFPISDKSQQNFAKNMKELFQNITKNIIHKYIKKKFIRSNKYTTSIIKIYSEIRSIEESSKDKGKKEIKKANKAIAERKANIDQLKNARDQEYDKIVKEFNDKISKELSQNFDTYFNNKADAEELYEFTVSNLGDLYKNYMKNDFSASLNNCRASFDKYIEFTQYLTRAYLISSYSNAKLNVANITEINLDEVDINDLFSAYASSGFFNYINDFVRSLEKSSEKDSKISIGQIFAAVPVINKFLKQFVASQNTNLFKLENLFADEKELASQIICYAFKSSDDDFKQKMTDFVKFIVTALNELRTFKDGFPYFRELNNEFKFLIKYLPIGTDE